VCGLVLAAAAGSPSARSAAPGAAASPARPACEWFEIALATGPPNCLSTVVDGNVPVHWLHDGLVPRATAFARVDADCCESDCYRSARITGASLAELERAVPTEIDLPQPAAGWRGLESTWLGPDTDPDDPRETLYGWYHEEPHADCGPTVVLGSIPRIGAAKSLDDGRTWTDLGNILVAPPATSDWDGPNVFFCGGYGDFSVVLDHERRHFYIFFSSYRRMRDAPDGTVQQGVAVARLPYADRDAPRGKVEIWDGAAWVGHDPAAAAYHRLAPIFPATRDWHARCENRNCAIPACDLSKAAQRHAPCPRSGQCSDAMWGPTVHWNEAIGRWVMLMNRTCSPCWSTEGHYVSFNARLDDPNGWCEPHRVDELNEWYPQVLPLGAGETDKHVRGPARYTVGGQWCGTIEFRRAGAR
jgi:hypothetical protein